MATQSHLVAFAGSTRKDSLNKKLIAIATQGAREAGAKVTLIDLKDYPMPLYDEDLEKEQGMPDKAKELKLLFNKADGLLIASPEYNSGYSGVLKNTLDWISRPLSKDEPQLASFTGKVASIMAVSPGALGGLRGLYQLRSLLMNMNVMVHPNMRAIGNGFEAFDEQGKLKDEKQHKAILALGEQTLAMIS